MKKKSNTDLSNLTLTEVKSLATFLNLSYREVMLTVKRLKGVL